ncbi:MAG: hypothetical protein K6G55_02865, partial [Selenomonadaceae bacterium]|nr:hypothetical protein [Selenomonadaceae bacterium]
NPPTVTPQDEPVVNPPTVTPQDKPVVNPPTVTPQDKPVVNPPTVTPQDEPVVNPPTVTPQDKPVVNPPTVTPQDKPTVNPPTVTPQDKPTVNPPTVTPQDKPVVNPPTVTPQDKPVVNPPTVTPQDKPTVNPPTVTPQERPIPSPPIVNPQDTPQDTPIFTPPTINPQPQPINQPAQVIDEPKEPEKILPEPKDVDEPFEDVNTEERKPNTSARKNSAPKKNLRTLKPRFIKLAADETYTYYLDKNSVKWKKLPYSTTEYIADVWIRMIENSPRQLDKDIENYLSNSQNAEISLANEQGYQYTPEDTAVLSSTTYLMEHYYIRPKTNQIQFLCELEVYGRPQNTVKERAYDSKNWEDLVPGSVESIIYEATVKIIGKAKANNQGHMTFTDMLDEYLRISLG